MTSQRGTMSCVALREKKQKSMFIAEPVIKIEKKLRNNRLFDARWYTNLQRLQGARPNHVRWETYKRHLMTIPPFASGPGCGKNLLAQIAHQIAGFVTIVVYQSLGYHFRGGRYFFAKQLLK